MVDTKQPVTVIGAGLAGCEAAWQLARRGIPVTLRAMKPQKMTPAHHSPGFAELVCSNSLRSDQLENAVGLLKEELRRCGSLILRCADQTRVEAGIAYFERFTAALPDIPALAAVEEQQLLKLWEGLGYYSRARNLKKAAIQLMQEHNGQLPADFAALCRLPGLGEYSAGAIASIAFDIRVPAVDGNVLRVAARLMNDARNIEDTAVKKEFRQIVWEVLPQHRVGDFNQSLMELGALICLPNGRPLCESCPVRDLCQSCAAGTQLALPTRQKKPRRRKEEKTVLLLCRPGEVQITQRPADGLLASLWEFPTLPGLHTSAEVAELLSVPTEAVTPLGPATHIFTHIEWQMQGYRVELPPETPLWGGCISIPVAELFASYPIPSAYAAYLKTLR